MTTLSLLSLTGGKVIEHYCEEAERIRSVGYRYSTAMYSANEPTGRRSSAPDPLARLLDHTVSLAVGAYLHLLSCLLLLSSTLLSRAAEAALFNWCVGKEDGVE